MPEVLAPIRISDEAESPVERPRERRRRVRSAGPSSHLEGPMDIFLHGTTHRGEMPILLSVFFGSGLATPAI